MKDFESTLKNEKTRSPNWAMLHSHSPDPTQSLAEKSRLAPSPLAERACSNHACLIQPILPEDWLWLFSRVTYFSLFSVVSQEI